MRMSARPWVILDPGNVGTLFGGEPGDLPPDVFYSCPHLEDEESKADEAGQEKSNVFVLATKPGEQTWGVELVEPRKRTQGDEQRTCRSPRQVSGSRSLIMDGRKR